jgi:hypothetical protein
MPALNDCEMERLSDLFSQGKLSNAPEIAKLLKVEIRDRPDGTGKDGLQPYWKLLDRLLNRHRVAAHARRMAAL